MRNVARSPFTRLAGLLLIVVALAAAPRRRWTARVEDNANFFSADAVKQANDLIAQIKRDSGKDLYVLTLPAIPDELKSQYSPDQRRVFFPSWQTTRTGRRA